MSDLISLPDEPTDSVVLSIGRMLDHPSVYMGGASRQSQQTVRRIWPYLVQILKEEFRNE